MPVSSGPVHVPRQIAMNIHGWMRTCMVRSTWWIGVAAGSAGTTADDVPRPSLHAAVRQVADQECYMLNTLNLNYQVEYPIVNNITRIRRVSAHAKLNIMDNVHPSSSTPSRTPNIFFARKRNKYGSIFKTHILRCPCVMVSR